MFVLPVEGIIMFDCSDPSSKIRSSAELIAARIEVRHVGTEMNFTVGDGLHYGGFFNAPLKGGRDYYVIIRAVSQWKTVGAAVWRHNDLTRSGFFILSVSLLQALKSSCVLWAKVKGNILTLER